MALERSHRYTDDPSADISSTGEVLKLDTKDRPFVTAILHDADAAADYLVESHHEDSDTDSEWTTLADNDVTTGFRFSDRVPERWVRIRVDSAVSVGDTAHLSINAGG